MSETILNPRQQYILNCISEHSGIGQVQLLALSHPIYAVSRATILRDIQHLLLQNLITKSGNAQATLYYPAFTHPLLRPFILDRYFADPSDKRANVRTQFNFDIFGDLHDIFSESEMKTLTTHATPISRTETQLKPFTFKRELERFCVELSWKSSEIEGNTYSLFETEALLIEHKPAKGKSTSETQMIINHKTAFDAMLENRTDFRELSISTITQLHNILISKLNVPTGIRTDPVGITGTKYMPIDNTHQVREALEKTILTINSVKNPWEKALLAITMIPYIQIFADGNKRTGRMLGNAILLAYDYLPISYRSVDKEIVKEALIIFYEQNTILPFKKLFIEQVLFANATYFRTG